MHSQLTVLLLLAAALAWAASGLVARLQIEGGRPIARERNPEAGRAFFVLGFPDEIVAPALRRAASVS